MSFGGLLSGKDLRGVDGSMAHLNCRCGYSMWNGATPNDIEFTVFSDIRFCELLDEPCFFSGDPDMFPEDIMALMDRADYEIWRCPECGRLHVFDRQDSPAKVKYVYRLEES